MKKLLENTDDIAVIIDLDWYKLWKSRMDNPLMDAETLKLDDDDYIIEIGKKPNTYDDIQGQYIGLIKISANMILKVKKFYYEYICNEIDDYKNMYMTDLLTLISQKLCKIKAVKINGGWCEFDTVSDLNYELNVDGIINKKLIFGTKAENLSNLYNLTKDKLDVKICDYYYFTYKDFLDNSNRIITNIQSKFSDIIIIRSSCQNEDNENKYFSIY